MIYGNDIIRFRSKVIDRFLDFWYYNSSDGLALLGGPEARTLFINLKCKFSLFWKKLMTKKSCILARRQLFHNPPALRAALYIVKFVSVANCHWGHRTASNLTTHFENANQQFFLSLEISKFSFTFYFSDHLVLKLVYSLKAIKHSIRFIYDCNCILDWSNSLKSISSQWLK